MSGKKSKVEGVKETSRGLRGTIAEELAEGTDNFSKPSTDLLKFHGIYQQDDRDQRRERQQKKLPRAWSFMIRTKNPGGGELTPEQWEALVEVADRYADSTLRLTTRQCVQFHGVGKHELKATIRTLNERFITTYGACGDGNRNTMASPVADIAEGPGFDGSAWANRVSERLGFASTAYYDIWLDGERYTGDSIEDEPLYGSAYMPRKFKVAFATPEDNSVDALANDVGVFAIHGAEGLEGFQVCVGGGMGSTHGNTKTFPRLADPLAFVDPESLLDVIQAIFEVQRDHGNRSDRKQARMKYLVHHWGIDRFRSEVEARLGASLAPPRSLDIQPAPLHHGWHRERTEGLWYLGVFVECGRIRDDGDSRMKTALTEVVRRLQTGVRLTAAQDLILTHIREEDRAEVERILEEHGVGWGEPTSALRRHAIACPALPTCGLALTEAERFLPQLMDQLEASGVADLDVDVRMTGCPNACCRPPAAELGLMGRSTAGYSIYVGGSPAGTRIAWPYAEEVAPESLATELTDLLRTWRSRREADEAFGDFCHRVGVDRLREWTGTSATPPAAPWPTCAP